MSGTSLNIIPVYKVPTLNLVTSLPHYTNPKSEVLSVLWLPCEISHQKPPQQTDSRGTKSEMCQKHPTVSCSGPGRFALAPSHVRSHQVILWTRSMQTQHRSPLLGVRGCTSEWTGLRLVEGCWEKSQATLSSKGVSGLDQV